MYWLNIDYPTGLWKLHLESCRYCNPSETVRKGVNKFKAHGAWVNFESFEKAALYFKESREHDSIWQPCKTCNPKQK